MPRAYISPVTKLSILRDLDRGVSRKELLSQYGLKSYSNIYRIIQQRGGLLDSIDRTMNRLPPTAEVIDLIEDDEEKTNVSTAAGLDHLLIVRVAKLRLRSRIVENVFNTLKEQINVHITKMEDLHSAIEDVEAENNEEVETSDDDGSEQDEEDNQQINGIKESKVVLKAYLDYMTSLNILNDTVETLDEGVGCLYKEGVRLGKLLNQKEGSTESTPETESTMDTDEDEDDFN
jgi:hypothetical protein